MSSKLETTYAALPATKRGESVLLGGDPKNGKKFLYCNGSTVYTRDLANPMLVETYNEHAANTTVARLSPSGFYCASADSHGKIRIWDTVNAEHILKVELRPISGAVRDLQWSEDSKRIAVCGEGSDKFGAVVMWDTGSSVGEISGHSKTINSIDFKQTRPFRVCTASEDSTTCFFQGPPFKFDTCHKDHSRFVNCARFAPNGEKYVTVSSDMGGVIYDGKTGERVAKLGGGDKAHGGSIMCCSWSADSTKLLTASADKTVKIWDMAANTCAQTFTLGSEVDDQQLGCLWQGDFMLSVSLSGYINYLDAGSGKVSQVLKGHTKAVTALAVTPAHDSFFSGSYDGRVAKWSVGDGSNDVIAGAGHTNQLVGADVSGDKLYSAALDDTVRVTAGMSYGDACKTTSAPRAVATQGNVTVTANVGELEVFCDGKPASKLAVDYEPGAVAIHPAGSKVYAGGKDHKLYVYALAGNALTQEAVLDGHRAVITCIAVAADGNSVASGDSNRSIIWWKDGKLGYDGWCFHSSRVTTLAWSPNSQYLLSGGLDGAVFVWNTQLKTRKIAIKGCHTGGVTKVAWLADDVALSAGQDANVKKHQITHHVKK